MKNVVLLLNSIKLSKNNSGKQDFCLFACGKVNVTIVQSWSWLSSKTKASLGEQRSSDAQMTKPISHWIHRQDTIGYQFTVGYILV